MARTLGIGVVAGLFVLTASGSARAFTYCYPVYRVVYSYPVIPVYCPPVIPIQAWPPPPPSPYAQPRPAPPSGTSEPPLDKSADRAPKVSESRYDSGKTQTAATDRLRVGFWNLTGRDLTVTIDGRKHTLPRNRAITLTLARQFSWNLDNEVARTEQVPADQATFEVLLRATGS